MCPVDDCTTNEAGEDVHSIPDYVLGHLLGEIADKKGHNIVRRCCLSIRCFTEELQVVIMDCCHSGPSSELLCFSVPDLSAGGMDRDIETNARGVAGASRSIPVDLDSQFWKGKGEAVPYRRKSVSPYVLLAACGADEKAREITKPDGTHGGRFTTALIPLLQQAPLEHTTFAELMGQRELEDLGGQRPRCVGGRSNRPVLNEISPARGQRSVLLTPQKKRPARETPSSSQLFRVEMGTLQGIRPSLHNPCSWTTPSWLGRKRHPSISPAGRVR
ncbi:hypothetical protein K438DRAFT_1807827 [Mycena galopus ATCC 62051]|nr:hypothetical protein K438DRAFT_1807827 [Mycena galopus ATCC 62051]